MQQQAVSRWMDGRLSVRWLGERERPQIGASDKPNGLIYKE